MIILNQLGENQVVVMPGETERDIRVQMMQLALENNGWNITKAAKSIGIRRTTFSERLRTWELCAGLKEQEL